MSNGRLLDFKKRQAKEALVAANSAAKQTEDLFRNFLALIKKVNALEKEVLGLGQLARLGDWRSTATLAQLDAKGVISKADVVAAAEAMQIKHFNNDSDWQDKVYGFENADLEACGEGHIAIVSLKLFKEGKELIDQAIVRTRLAIGKNSIFPEVDMALTGMKVNETKTFPLNLMNETDEAQVTLLGLRKQKAKEVKDAETTTAN